MSFSMLLGSLVFLLFAHCIFASSDVPHAHFDFVWPASRGGDVVFNPINAAAPFCGGFETPSATRTPFPLSGGPVQLKISNWTENFPSEGRMVDMNLFIAVRDDVGSRAFNDESRDTVFPQLKFVHETFSAGGLFCFGNVTFPEAFALKEGTKATLQISVGVSGFDSTSMNEPQVIANNKQCADIVFTSSALSSEAKCQNDPIIIHNNGNNAATVSYTPPASTAAVQAAAASTSSTTNHATPAKAKSGAGQSRTIPLASWQYFLWTFVAARSAMWALF